ncbi:MAG: galactonate dehydratase [Propionibacteriales bacterium]|nr:galactonate dehydratase [Propionibacteriales bacterium]
MKITNLTSVVVGAGMRNWVFVKITTDEGIVGWGEATTEWRTHSVVGALEDFGPIVVGQDPFRIEHLWQTMHRGQFWKGGLVTMSAISGIDQALHDVKAQALGVPIYDLLGGRVRDEIRMYDHLGGGAPEMVYGNLPAERAAEVAVQSVEAGFDAVKILPVPVVGALPTGADLRHAHDTMAAVRAAVGPDVDIMVDLHGRCTPAGAAEFARRLRDHRPWFIEEPCPPELVDELPSIAACGVPLALGERLVGRSEFLGVLKTGAVAVIQPDVCHCGGISELRRIAALAETFGVSVAPHNPLGPIATAHNLHFAAATPNFLIQEQMRNAVPWYDDVVDGALVVRNGKTAIPDGPGLGLAVVESEAAKHPFVADEQIMSTHADGSVADW